jgi:hypothetical protein
MKTQNLLLTVAILILLNILFYNINTVNRKTEETQSSVNNGQQAIIELAGKILEMNSVILASQPKYQGNNLSIRGLKELLGKESKISFDNQEQLDSYIKNLYRELNNKDELPFEAAVPGGQRKIKVTANNAFSVYPMIASANSKRPINYSLIDKMDDIYFSSTNQMRGVETTETESETDKDLAEFNRYVNYVNPEVIKVDKEQFKGTDYISIETLLNTNNYYEKNELKKYMKAEKLTKELKGYCINILVTDEILSPNHPVFENYGGLMVEEVSKNEYRYFIGNFRTRNGANSHLEKVISSKFPEAEVVYYKKGNRKSNLWQFFFGPLVG